MPKVMLVIDPYGPTPLYVQVADDLQRQIEAGRLPPNRPVPSEVTIQQTYGVARGTARKGIELLRERGLVTTVPGKGTYVLPRSEQP